MRRTGSCVWSLQRGASIPVIGAIRPAELPIPLGTCVEEMQQDEFFLVGQTGSRLTIHDCSDC
jgi:hypothetical protein